MTDKPVVDDVKRQRQEVAEVLEAIRNGPAHDALKQMEADHKAREAQSPYRVEERVREAQRDMDKAFVPLEERIAEANKGRITVDEKSGVATISIDGMNKNVAERLVKNLNAIATNETPIIAEFGIKAALEVSDRGEYVVKISPSADSPNSAKELVRSFANNRVVGGWVDTTAEEVKYSQKSQAQAPAFADILAANGFTKGRFEDQSPPAREESGPLPKEVDAKGQQQAQEQKDMRGTRGGR